MSKISGRGATSKSAPGGLPERRICTPGITNGLQEAGHDTTREFLEPQLENAKKIGRIGPRDEFRNFAIKKAKQNVLVKGSKSFRMTSF